MLIKVNQILKGYDGKPIKESTEKDAKDVVLQSVLLNALNYLPKDRQPAVENKVKAYRLSLEVMAKDEVEFTIEDLALIKVNLNELYAPLIVGQVVDILEKGGK